MRFFGLSALILAFSLVFAASSANATPNTGTFDLQGGLGNGGWQEFFTANGQHGQPGNELIASGYDPGHGTDIQWAFYGVLQSVIGSSNPDFDYETTYIGDLVLYEDPDTWGADPWGNAIELFDFTLTNYSKRWDTGEATYLSFMAMGSAAQDGYNYGFLAAFNGIEGVNYYPEMQFEGLQGPIPGHMGNGFAIASVEVSAVPVPAAIWLLGSGMMGLFGLRRKMR